MDASQLSVFFFIQTAAILVLMAILTTLMASPVFEWVYGRHARRTGELGAAPLGA